MSAPHRPASIIEIMERSTVTPGFSAAVERTAADAASAIQALSETDLVRLKALAQLWSRGLPGGIGWTDVLHEAIVRILDGSRVWPPDVQILAFLSGVMRSICDDYWRRVRHEQKLLVSRDDQNRCGPAADTIDEVANPERVAVAVAGLAEVFRLFAGDPVALQIIDGMSNGLTAKDICKAYGISALDYDTARRRMRRTLLRHQQNWSEL
jgi:DNA-directed RNA polymerase specialized sigma24 family protein